MPNRFLGSCGLCNEQGFLLDSQGFDCIPCDCLMKQRAFNRLCSSGFSESILDFVSSDRYSFPVIEEGESFLTNYINNPKDVELAGLGLFLYSETRGKGKTTLTHKIMFDVTKSFCDKSVYSSEREYAFENIESFMNDFAEENWKKTWYVLDDLGNENLSGWKRDAIITNLHRMLHYRRDNQLPLVITSNFPPERLSSLYGGKLDSLLEIRPDGLLGGLMYRAVKVGGQQDFRLGMEGSKWNSIS